MARKLYLGVTLVVVAVGIVGVVLAASWPCSQMHGGRGGAAGVVIALAAIWMKPRFHITLLHDLQEYESEFGSGQAAGDEDQKIQELDQRALTRWVRALSTSILVASAIEKQAINWLAAATAIGTAFWGFGDLMSVWLRDKLVWSGLAEAAQTGTC